MRQMTRAVTALAVLTLAAIPVGALTVKNNSGGEVSIGVDNGTAEEVYKIAPGGSVDVRQDCSSDCAVTGPWGYSRLVAQNATIETDGTSLVTAANAEASSPALIPQNPADEPATAAASAPARVAAKPAAAEAAPSAEKPAAATASKKAHRRAAQPRKPATKQASKKGPIPGTLQMLWQGTGK